MKVYIDEPQAVCLDRRIARDCAERGRTEAMVSQQWAEQVEPMFRRHIEPTRPFADYVMSFAPRETQKYASQIFELFQTLEKS